VPSTGHFFAHKVATAFGQAGIMHTVQSVGPYLLTLALYGQGSAGDTDIYLRHDDRLEIGMRTPPKNQACDGLIPHRESVQAI
jgi:hypothetical protein